MDTFRSLAWEDKYSRLPVSSGGGRNRQLRCSGAPGTVDLPLLDCFVLVHVDGGDGMLGARLHFPVHLPLGAFRLGLQQVHPLLGFDPAGNGEKIGEESILLEAMIYVQGRRWAPPCTQQSSLLVLRHGKSNSTDESITEMNEDGSAMIHEARRRGLLRVTVLANTFCEAVGCTHWAFIINYWYLEASKVGPHAVNETFIRFRHNIIRPH